MLICSLICDRHIKCNNTEDSSYMVQSKCLINYMYCAPSLPSFDHGFSQCSTWLWWCILYTFYVEKLIFVQGFNAHFYNEWLCSILRFHTTFLFIYYKCPHRWPLNYWNWKFLKNIYLPRTSAWNIGTRTMLAEFIDVNLFFIFYTKTGFISSFHISEAFPFVISNWSPGILFSQVSPEFMSFSEIWLGNFMCDLLNLLPDLPSFRQFLPLCLYPAYCKHFNFPKCLLFTMSIPCSDSSIFH